MKRYIKSGSTIPRNATRIKARPKDEYVSSNPDWIYLYKDGVYWHREDDIELPEAHLYDPDYLRNNYDIEVVETNPNYKPNRTKVEFVVQGNYGYGWDDLTYSDSYAEATQDLRDYNENEAIPHRIITRRVPVEVK